MEPVSRNAILLKKMTFQRSQQKLEINKGRRNNREVFIASYDSSFGAMIDQTQQTVRG